MINNIKFNCYYKFKIVIRIDDNLRGLQQHQIKHITKGAIEFEKMGAGMYRGNNGFWTCRLFRFLQKR
jgi:hypothetical protein